MQTHCEQVNMSTKYLVSRELPTDCIYKVLPSLMADYKVHFYDNHHIIKTSIGIINIINSMFNLSGYSFQTMKTELNETLIKYFGQKTFQIDTIKELEKQRIISIIFFKNL